MQDRNDTMGAIGMRPLEISEGPSEMGEDEFGHLDGDDRKGRKILYYNSFGMKMLNAGIHQTGIIAPLKKIIHWVTSILMIASMLTLLGFYVYRFVELAKKDYDFILARVIEQDPAITNRVATVSVLRYAIWHNSTSNNATESASTDTSTVTSSNTAESYTDLTPYCETNEVFLAQTESKAETLIKDTKHWVGFVIDAFFMFLMLLTAGFVVFISVFKLKLQHIPLFMRSSKIT